MTNYRTVLSDIDERAAGARRSDTERPSDTPRVHVKTYGCQMNVYDGERMAEALVAEGFQTTASPADADVIVLNTCHIREKAAEKVYSELGRLRALQSARAADNQRTYIAVAGCVAQAEGEEILRRAPIVDLVIGPQSYHRLPGLLAEVKRTGRAVVDTEFADADKFDALPQRSEKRAPTAFLTVQEGCDKFCTFCVVPYTRGVEFSRPVADIVTEARRLVDGGVREITLLGQNVNAYHGMDEIGRQTSLADLLHRLSELEGLARLRFTTSHPHDMTDDLIAAHRDNPKLMPYLHLPFQAGSDRILKAMNRKHTAADYRALIARIRQARPDLALSTDVIVGFPGETDDDFDETLALVRDITFAQAFSFKYSPRPGTPAAELPDQVAEPVKSERLQRLQSLLSNQQTAFNASCVGRSMDVLLEKPGRHAGQCVGRSPYLQAVHVEASPDDIGGLVSVEITSSGPNSLGGVIKSVSCDAMDAAEQHA